MCNGDKNCNCKAETEIRENTPEFTSLAELERNFASSCSNKERMEAFCSKDVNSPMTGRQNYILKIALAFLKSNLDAFNENNVGVSFHPVTEGEILDVQKKFPGFTE